MSEFSPFNFFKERLQRPSYLYDSRELDRVREKLAGKQVVFIDVNGVLCTNREPINLNPQAKVTLDLLKQRGYFLAAWTTADQILIKRLQKLGIDSHIFDHVIAAEHYVRTNPQQQKLFHSAVQGCAWLSDEVKNVLKHASSSAKTPALLCNGPFAFIEDHGSYLLRQSPTEQIINLYTYGADNLDNRDNKPIFGTHIVNEIENRGIFTTRNAPQ